MSKKFTLSIDTGNAAFNEFEFSRDQEIGRILAKLAEQFLTGQHNTAPGNFETLYDINGNNVGRWVQARR